jgi:hypothetical protein
MQPQVSADHHSAKAPYPTEFTFAAGINGARNLSSLKRGGPMAFGPYYYGKHKWDNYLLDIQGTIESGNAAQRST